MLKSVAFKSVALMSGAWFSGAAPVRRHPVASFFVDFVLGLAVFAFVVGMFSISSSNAFPAPPPADLMIGVRPVAAAFVPALADVAPAIQFEPGVPAYTLFLFAIAFSTLTAMNLAVWRHLRTAYASPRRRS